MNRKGIEDDIKYYFPDNEPIWYIGESLSDRKELNEALNRESIKIDNLDELIHNVEMAQVNGEPYASLIIMERIPNELQENLSQLKIALDIMEHVKIYEIGRDPLFEFGQTVPSIYKLKELSFDRTRSKNIKQYTDPTDKQAQILQSLEMDLVKSRAKEKELQEVIENIKSEKVELEDKVKELSFDIDEKYLSKITRLKEQVESLEDTLTNLNIDLETERNKTKQYSIDLSKKTSLISEKEYELKASDSRLKDRDNKIDKLKKEKAKLEEEIEKLEINQRKLMSTSVDEETVVVLQETLESERLRKKILEDDIENLNIELKNKDYEIRNLQNTISQIRNGESELATVGRTYNLDTGTLNKTTLIYVKVFEELPYLKLYCNHLFKMLLETTYKSGLMVVIKNDDGLDSKIFQGLGLLANFNDLEVNKNMYRLYPSSTMFSGLEQVDNDVEFLFVVDYIKSKDYYLNSTSKQIYMTSASHSKKIKEFDLKGLPISLDRDSVVDIKYDPSIANSAMKSNRELFVTQKVVDWYKRLDLGGY